MSVSPLPRRTFVAAAALAAFAPHALAQARIDGALAARQLAELVDLEYPDADAAAALAARLRAHARAGRYRNLAPEALAERLTEDLRASIRDEHLRVRYAPDEARYREVLSRTPPTAMPPIPASPGPQARAVFEPINYGFQATELLPGNIGLIRWSTFPPLYDVVRQRIDAMMTLLADTWGLVIDLRENGGGEPSSGDYLMSYLFEREPFVLNRIHWRRLPAEESTTTRTLGAPSYGETRPVFVVMSQTSFSAAEALAYGLQALGRARVVGEVSRGGANPGNFFNIGQGFVAFVPQGRALNPVTNANWEGVGVAPDIAAPAAQALTAANRAAIEAALAQAPDDSRRNALREGLEELGS